MESRATRHGEGLAVLGYVLLIVYGSLYPFSGWVDAPDCFAFLYQGLSSTQVQLGDLVTNVLAYVPLGFLVCRLLLAKRVAGAWATALAIATAFVLSLSMEMLQGFLPTRVQSDFDLLTNTFGGTLGAIAAGLPGRQGALADILRKTRSEWFVPGRFADLGLFALGAWFFRWLLPLLPSIDLGRFRAGLAPIALAIANPHSFNGWRALAETLSWAGIGLIAKSQVRSEKPGFAVVAILFVCILAAQIPIVRRYLTPELLVGCLAGLLLVKVLADADVKTRANLAFLLIFAGFCIEENIASSPGMLYPFNWIPFATKLDNTLSGIESLLELIGFSAALAWCARSGADKQDVRWFGWAAGLLVTGGAFALELGQRHVPGRIGDITSPLLIGFTWIMSWRWTGQRDVTESLHVPAASLAAEGPSLPSPPRILDGPVARPIRTYLLALVSLTAAIWLIAQQPAVPYNIRELLYPGHPIRSAALLSLALFLTLAAPAWFVAWILRRPVAVLLLPIALASNAFLTWVSVVNSVPSRNLHDIVGSPILHWAGETETCVRFIALHSAITLLVTGGVLLAVCLFHPRPFGLVLGWLFLILVFGPLLHWAIVTQAATDNLTELMRDGGSAPASILLALAGILSFLTGSLVAASVAFARRRLRALVLAAACSVGAYLLFVAGTEPALDKYGKVFSALQFMLSPDRAHYVGQGELVARYATAFLLLIAATALLQYRAWVAMAAGMPRRNATARTAIGGTNRVTRV